MNFNDTSNFKATALSDEILRGKAPSIFASGPMQGVSDRYTFVPTARIVDGLREQDWVPVDVEEQRIRKEARRGFQKHMIRFRRAEQMETLDEWNIELVLLNSHDRCSAYQLHAGIRGTKSRRKPAVVNANRCAGPLCESLANRRWPCDVHTRAKGVNSKKRRPRKAHRRAAECDRRPCARVIPPFAPSVGDTRRVHVEPLKFEHQ